MSIYSLENNSAFNYYVKHRENLLYLSDREYANTYFKIGEKINKKEQMFSQVMLELLCTENCELINYINDKLSGKQEGKIKHLEEVTVQNGGNITYNITNIVESDMHWGNEGDSTVPW